MTYILFYATPEPPFDDPDATWAVYSEQYESIEAHEPIEGTTEMVSGNHPTEASAQDYARSKQRASYSANRRASHGA